MYEDLKIILYPDPRLRKVSADVTEFGEPLIALAKRMFELMREHKGVGLAAPQVGINQRLFVMNATGEAADDRIYVNPGLFLGDGAKEDEEGCLSLPDIRVSVIRDAALHMKAQDVAGNVFEEDAADDYIARIWQHENDHLDGRMLIDRMGPVAKMTSRKKLKELEEKFKKEQSAKTLAKAVSARAS